MIKAITQSPRVRNLVLAAMIAGSAIGAQAVSNPARSNSSSSAQTEVMSSQAASAVTASRKASAPALEYNKKVAKHFLKDGTEAQKAENLKGIKDMCAEHGTYYATMMMQLIVDDGYLKEIVDKFPAAAREHIELETAYMKRAGSGFLGGAANSSNLDFTNLDKNINTFKNFTTNGFVNLRAELMSKVAKTGQYPTYEACSQVIDNYVLNEIGYFTDTDKKGYKDSVNAYRAKMTPAYRNSVQGKSDVIAYKMFMLDSMLIDKNSAFLKKNFNAVVDLGDIVAEHFHDKFAKQAMPR